MKHRLHSSYDHPIQSVISSCFICDGDLALCITCGGAEGAMPTDCPGVQMSEQQTDDVYAGKIDYRNGQWVSECSPHSPRALDDIIKGEQQ